MNLNADNLFTPFEERGGGDHVLLIQIHFFMGRHQVPEVVIFPERKGEHVVDVEVPVRGNRLVRPDTRDLAHIREELVVEPGSFQDLPFSVGFMGEEIENLFAGKGMSLCT